MATSTWILSSRSGYVWQRCISFRPPFTFHLLFSLCIRSCSIFSLSLFLNWLRSQKIFADTCTSNHSSVQTFSKVKFYSTFTANVCLTCLELTPLLQRSKLCVGLITLLLSNLSPSRSPMSSISWCWNVSYRSSVLFSLIIHWSHIDSTGGRRTLPSNGVYLRDMSSSQLISYCAKYREAAEDHRGISVLIRIGKMAKAKCSLFVLPLLTRIVQF